MKKLRITVVIEMEVRDEDLVHYEASSIEEAAANQQRYFDEGQCGISRLGTLPRHSGTSVLLPQVCSNPGRGRGGIDVPTVSAMTKPTTMLSRE